MLAQIWKECPKDDFGTRRATHYQLAVVHQPTEQNARGAGRPSWFPTQPLPMNEAPDVMSGLYAIRYLVSQPQSADGWGVVHRCEIDLRLPQAAAPPPAPASPAAPAERPRAVQPPDPSSHAGQYALHGAVELLGFTAEGQKGLILDWQAQVSGLQAQLAAERSRGDTLQQKLDQAAIRTFDLTNLIMDKVQVFMERVQATPSAPQELPYIAVIRELVDGAKAFAPGINARMASLGQPALPPYQGPPVQLAEGLVLLLSPDASKRVQGHQPLQPLLQALAAPGVYLVRDMGAADKELRAIGLEFGEVTRVQAPEPAPATPPPAAPTSAQRPAPAEGEAEEPEPEEPHQVVDGEIVPPAGARAA